ncbi:MAG TPA: acireductone dioxygenase [Gammaproteobacteria bacterium]|nr:acireductone dioxygenase [Gammaproteobacteria bacterium]
MAVLSFRDTGGDVREAASITALLAERGVAFRQWQPGRPLGSDATADEVLAAYAHEIDLLKAEGGYVTADVIDIHPDTPNLDTMLAKFDKEHWHDEDEVRFIIEGHGLFHLNLGGEVVSVTVGPGDMLVVPGGSLHWFHLCEDRRIRAIRLFKDMSGWTPHYSDSGKDRDYPPVCIL